MARRLVVLHPRPRAELAAPVTRVTRVSDTLNFHDTRTVQVKPAPGELVHTRAQLCAEVAGVATDGDAGP